MAVNHQPFDILHSGVLLVVVVAMLQPRLQQITPGYYTKHTRRFLVSVEKTIS